MHLRCCMRHLLFGESCNEDVGSDECEAAGGTFLGNVSCTTGPCAPPAPTGACCVDGQCTIETEEDCSGLYLGDDLPCDNNPCGDDGGDGPFIGIRYDVLGTNLVTDDEETWTVDVYAVLADGCRLDAVAGDINQSKMVSTTGSFYQNIYGGPTSQDINPSLFSAFPDLEYDSFVTIGLTDQNGNALSNIGIDWTDFEAGGAIDSTDGSWYVTPEDVQGDSGTFQDQFCEDNNGVRIARLTVRGLDSIVFFEALFQGKDGGGTTWQANDSMAIAYDDCDAHQLPRRHQSRWQRRRARSAAGHRDMGPLRQLPRRRRRQRRGRRDRSARGHRQLGPLPRGDLPRRLVLWRSAH